MAKRGRPRKIENTFQDRNKTKFSEPPKSKGILADDVTRTVVRSKEGSIEHTPTLPKHIVNKEYVDLRHPIPFNDFGEITYSGTVVSTQTYTSGGTTTSIGSWTYAGNLLGSVTTTISGIEIIQVFAYSGTNNRLSTIRTDGVLTYSGVF